MKPPFIASTGIALLLATVAVGPVADRSAPPQHPSLLVKHSPIQPRRNEDGSLKRGLREEVATENWSGYAVASFETSTPQNAVYYYKASGWWTIPKVSYAPFGRRSRSWEYSSSWVGIGGYCENSNCTSGDNSLIQLGTEQDVSPSGATDYYAWYEMLPDNPVLIPYPVQPGDFIEGHLECTAPCTPGAEQTWLLTMQNFTEGWFWQTTVQYQSSLLSADWIQEAPWYNGVLPLADYGAMGEFGTRTNGADTNLTLATNGIVMEDPWGQTSNPSAPLAGQVFNACWGNGTTLTSCPEP